MLPFAFVQFQIAVMESAMFAAASTSISAQRELATRIAIDGHRIATIEPTIVIRDEVMVQPLGWVSMAFADHDGAIISNQTLVVICITNSRPDPESTMIAAGSIHPIFSLFSRPVPTHSYLRIQRSTRDSNCLTSDCVRFAWGLFTCRRLAETKLRWALRISLTSPRKSRIVDDFQSVI